MMVLFTLSERAALVGHRDPASEREGDTQQVAPHSNHRLARPNRGHFSTPDGHGWMQLFQSHLCWSRQAAVSVDFELRSGLKTADSVHIDGPAFRPYTRSISFRRNGPRHHCWYVQYNPMGQWAKP